MLRIREIYSDTARTVSVVEAVESWDVRSAGHRHVIGRLEPLAVVIRDPDREYAFDLDGERLAPERLSRMVAAAASESS